MIAIFTSISYLFCHLYNKYSLALVNRLQFYSHWEIYCANSLNMDKLLDPTKWSHSLRKASSNNEKHT